MEMLLAILLNMSPGTGSLKEDTYCYEISSGEAEVGEERAYLERFCQIELATHKGVVAAVEGGFLPFLEEFYLMVPERSEIYLSSSGSFRNATFAELVHWPYGSIWIYRSDWLEEERIETALKVVESSYLTNVSESCDKVVRLSFGEVSGEQLEFTFEVYELRIGDTVIRMSQASVAFAVVIAETFKRINCPN